MPRAFHVDDVIARLTDVVASGHFPILAGESGVGKSAVVHELCRRQAAGNGPTFKVPRLLIDPAVPFDSEEAERFFRSRVLGQTEAARAVVHMISLIKAGLSDPRRPFGSFLFVGPTGVGKTRGVLHARVAGHPFAVLLLDELEKAHLKVHDRFLQLFDEGVFINGAGTQPDLEPNPTSTST